MFLIPDLNSRDVTINSKTMTHFPQSLVFVLFILLLPRATDVVCHVWKQKNKKKTKQWKQVKVSEYLLSSSLRCGQVNWS